MPLQIKICVGGSFFHSFFYICAPFSNRGKFIDYAGVAKLADALDLGSSAARHGGSSPSARTQFFAITCLYVLFLQGM